VTLLRLVTIRSRLGDFTGLANADAAIFDRFDPKAGRVVRHYILLNESVKLMFEPWGWVNQWYVDLVSIRWIAADTLELADLYIDVIVEGSGPVYRLIDLEEFADALRDGKISAEDMNTPLHALQRFLDDHLHGGKDFPPAAIRPMMALPRL
jgi:predicted RNA-binding protein associated with RNAse of E/G family